MSLAVNRMDMVRWAHQAETQKFLGDLRDSRQETMEVWARCGFAGAAEFNAKALGGINVLDQVIELITDLTSDTV